MENTDINPVNAVKFEFFSDKSWDDIGFPGATKYFLMKGGPWKTAFFSTLYLGFVMYLAPTFMRDRNPFEFKKLMVTYNIFLVAMNTYLLYNFLGYTNWGLDMWHCGDGLSDRYTNNLLVYCNMFFFMRYFEFLDTLFFILRKKTSQVTFLHVFHHAIVPYIAYFGFKFFPIPFNALIPTTNMFIHIIMYTYYALAAFPQLNKYLWWKKYLTILQIAQFSLFLFHCAYSLFLARRGCPIPNGLLFINSLTGLIFLVLFSMFYIKTYTKKHSKIKVN